MVSMTSNGETVFVCLPCMPEFTAALFAVNGIPGLMFDFAEAETEDADAAVFDQAPAEPEAVPEGPGVLELVEKKEGPQAVANGRAAARKRAAHPVDDGQGENFETSEAADVTS